MEREKGRRPSDDPRLRLQEELDEVPTTTQNPNHRTGGISCPNCGCNHTSVSHTYSTPDSIGNDAPRIDFSGKQYIRRRRVCENCQLPFTTREVIEPEMPDEIRSPSQAAKVQKIINSTVKNVIPNLPENPFL